MQDIEDKSQEVLQFYRELCRFNFYSDLKSSEYRGINLQLDQHFGHEHQIPLTFSSETSYSSFWKGLFWQELKGYLKSCNSQWGKPQLFQLATYFNLASFRVLEFKKTLIGSQAYQPGSLVVLSPLKPLSNDPSQPHLFGIVYKSQTNLHARVLLEEANAHFDVFTTSQEWFIQTLGSLSSAERQYKALSRLAKIHPNLREALLRSQFHANDASKTFHIPSELDRSLRESYNPSQYAAVIACLKQEGFTLVQGPPGTGKTKTLLGTLSVLLNSSPSVQDEEQPLILMWRKSQKQRRDNKALNPWMNRGFNDWRDAPFLDETTEADFSLTQRYMKGKDTDRVVVMGKTEEVSSPSRVLICGPSNASVDQVIRKLLLEGLLDEYGHKTLPRFVRIGENYHQSLQQYSLQALTAKKMRDKGLQFGAARREILLESQLVFATLSAAGSGIVETAGVDFDTVLIDEAGQAVEPACLIPLGYGCRRVVLIGDPSQLSATIFSPTCLARHYDQSLLQRLMKNDFPVSVLRTQYRMNPQISRVVATAFYGGLLEDGPLPDPLPLGLPSNFLMLHLSDSYEEFYDQSYRNPSEAKLAIQVVNYLSKKGRQIGIISPYSAQVRLLNHLELPAGCQAKTIDSFQGREKEVIVISTVRAARVGPQKTPNLKKSVGFVGDPRRLNVALSRARFGCVVIGDLGRLSSNKLWGKIIRDAIIHGQAYRADGPPERFEEWVRKMEKRKLSLSDKL